MRSIVISFIILTLVSLCFACIKNIDGDGNEPDLYGTWSKGTHLGDTLWFMKKDGQHLVRIPKSFNSMSPGYTEAQYRLKDGELSIKLFAPYSQEYRPISSFKWTNPGKEFSVQNTELFMFMSSFVTFTYKKL